MSYSDSDSDSTDSWDVTSFKPVDLKKIYKCKLGISTIFEPAFVGNLKTAQDNSEGLIFVLQEKMPEGLNLKIIQKSSTPYLKDQASTQTLLFEVPEQKFQNFLNTLDQVLEISHDSALLNQYRTEFSQRQSKTHVYRYCIEGCYLSVREFRPGQRYSFPGVRVCCYEEAKSDDHETYTKRPISQISIRCDQFKYLQALLRHYHSFGTFRTLLIARTEAQRPFFNKSDVQLVAGSCFTAKTAYSYPESEQNRRVFDHVRTCLTVHDLNTNMMNVHNDEEGQLFFKCKMRQAKESKRSCLDLHFTKYHFYVNQHSLGDFVRFLDRFEQDKKPMSVSEFELIKKLFTADNGFCPLE